jgi:hypothetical protein
VSGEVKKLTGLVNKLVGEPPERTASFLPADTLAYFTINLEPGAGQLARARGIKSIFEATLSYESKRDEVLADIEDETGIDVVDGLYDWVGSDVTFALLGVEGESAGDWVVLVRTNDRDASEVFLDDLVIYLTDEEFMEFVKFPRGRDAIVYIEENEEVSFGLNDRYALVASNSTVVRDVLRDIESPPANSLSGDVTFQQVAARLNTERFLLGFVRGEEIYKRVLREHDISVEPSPRRYIPKFSGISGTFLDGGVRVDLYTDTPPGVTLAANENPLSTASIFPQDTLFWVSGTGLEQAWLLFRDTREYLDEYGAGDFDDALGDFEVDTGIDVEEDIVRQLVSEFAVGVFPSRFRLNEYDEFTSGAIEVAGVAKMGNTAGAEIALDELMEILEDEEAIVARRRSVGNYEAVVLDLSQQEVEVRGFSPGYLFAGELVIGGSTLDSLFRVTDILDGAGLSLNTNPAFSRLAELAPENASYVLFADISGLVDMVVDSLAPDTRADYDNEVRPFLQPFDSFFAAATSNSDFILLTVVVTFKR